MFRDAGYNVHTIDDVFGPRKVADEEWIRFADDYGMAAVCKDAKIRRRPNERRALYYSNLRVLVLTEGKLQAAAMAERFRVHLPAIDALWRRHGPWVYAVRASGLERLHTPRPAD